MGCNECGLPHMLPQQVWSTPAGVVYHSRCGLPQQVWSTTAGVVYPSRCGLPQQVWSTPAGVVYHSRCGLPQQVWSTPAGVVYPSRCGLPQLVVVELKVAVDRLVLLEYPDGGSLGAGGGEVLDEALAVAGNAVPPAACFACNKMAPLASRQNSVQTKTNYQYISQ